MFVIVQVCYFLSQLGHITYHIAKVSHFFDFFFELLMLDSKCGQNGGHGPSKLGVESCKTITGSMIK
jgi:hypothetical protein